MSLLSERDNGLDDINDAKIFETDDIEIIVPEHTQLFKQVEYETEIALEQYKVLKHLVTKLNNLKAVRKDDLLPLTTSNVAMESFPNINSYTEDYSGVNYEETIKACQLGMEGIVNKISGIFVGFKNALRKALESRIIKMQHWSTLVDKHNAKFVKLQDKYFKALPAINELTAEEVREKLVKKSKFYTSLTVNSDLSTEEVLNQVFNYCYKEQLTELEKRLLSDQSNLRLLVDEYYNLYSNSASKVFERFVYLVDEGTKFVKDDYVSAYPNFSKNLQYSCGLVNSDKLEFTETVHSRILTEFTQLVKEPDLKLNSKLDEFNEAYNIVNTVDSFRLEYVFKVNAMFKRFNETNLDMLLEDSFSEEYIKVFKLVREDLFVTLRLIETLCAVGEAYCNLVVKSSPIIEDLIKLEK